MVDKPQRLQAAGDPRLPTASPKAGPAVQRKRAPATGPLRVRSSDRVPFSSSKASTSNQWHTGFNQVVCEPEFKVSGSGLFEAEGLFECCGSGPRVCPRDPQPRLQQCRIAVAAAVSSTPSRFVFWIRTSEYRLVCVGSTQLEYGHGSIYQLTKTIVTITNTVITGFAIIMTNHYCYDYCCYPYDHVCN